MRHDRPLADDGNLAKALTGTPTEDDAPEVCFGFARVSAFLVLWSFKLKSFIACLLTRAYSVHDSRALKRSYKHLALEMVELFT